LTPETEELSFGAIVPFLSGQWKDTVGPVKTEDARAGLSGATTFLTRSEVSKLLGVSPNTVTRWAREGRLPCQVTLGGHHRFDRELVMKLLKSLCRAGASPD
jgi:excisionase family DNA binding protein